MAASGLERIFQRSVTYLTFAARCPVLSVRTIMRFNNFGEFAVTSRKPALLRWLEEAEARQICEWAGLQQESDRRDFSAEPSRACGERLSLLRRLRGVLGNQTVQITRDDRRRDGLS